MMLFLPMIDAQRTLNNLSQWFDGFLLDAKVDHYRRRDIVDRNHYEHRVDESTRYEREVLSVKERRRHALQREGLGSWAMAEGASGEEGQ